MKVIVAILLFVATGWVFSQPAFKDYVYDSALEDYPKLTLPIAREDYLGIFDYMYQPTNTNCSEIGRTFDQNTCFRPTRASHPVAIDFGVSPFNFKYDDIVNPFPRGAKVKVTEIHDATQGQPNPPERGWYITITCFLDGNYNNTAFSNRYQIQFGHLKAGSFKVYEGQEDLAPGMALAQIGLSGLTTSDRPHTHAEFVLKGRPVDPFWKAGGFNPTTTESLWFDQAWVDRITNYKNSRTTMSFDNLKINGGFYVNFPNQALNQYRFKSQNGVEIAHLWMVASPDDDEIMIGEIDLIPSVGAVPATDGSLDFSFYNDAPNAGEFAFIAEYIDGAFSTKVWVEVSNSAVNPGLFRSSTNGFYLDRDGDGAISVANGDLHFFMGSSGDLALAGDWNGDGYHEVGVFRPGTNRFYLDLTGDYLINTGAGDSSFVMGAAGDLPLVGDWNGDGFDEVGLFRPSSNQFFLDVDGNGQINVAGGDRGFSMGASGDLPLTGDWNGDGFDEVGLFRPATNVFYLDMDGNDAISLANGDVSFAMGAANDRPLVGDWNNDCSDEVGLFRPSNNQFFLDANGNAVFSLSDSDKTFFMGQSGDLPLIGYWR